MTTTLARRLAISVTLVCALAACSVTGPGTTPEGGSSSDAVRASSGPASASSGPASASSDAVSAGVAQALAATETIAYGSDPAQVLDLTVPPALSDETVLVVMVHGGGWVEGSRHDMEWITANFIEAGFAVANIDYRLLDYNRPEPAPVTFADEMDDISAAITTAVERLGGTVDTAGVPSRPVSLVGGSAGGHLVLLYGALFPVALESIVALAPIADVSDPGQWPDSFVPTYSAVGAGLSLAGGARIQPGDSLEPAQASALAAVSPTQLAGPTYPPTLFIHGDADDVVPYEQSARMAQALTGMGVDSRLITLEGKKHFDNWDYDAMARDTIDWLASHSA